MMRDDVAQMGHNDPPDDALSFEEIQNGIEDLYDEAKQWLDGEEITTQKQADNLALLGDQVKKLEKACEAMRKERYMVHYNAGKAVNAQFKPIAEKAGRVKETIASALKPFMIEKQKAQRLEIEEKAKEAERLREEAQAAFRTSDVTNLAEREEAERKLEAFKEAEKDLAKAHKARPNVKGEGRARTIMTRKRVRIVDFYRACDYVAQRFGAELLPEVERLLNKHVNAAAAPQEIPGVVIEEDFDVR